MNREDKSGGVVSVIKCRETKVTFKGETDRSPTIFFFFLFRYGTSRLTTASDFIENRDFYLGPTRQTREVRPRNSSKALFAHGMNS